MKEKILVTGGAGYIGSHTCLELLNEGYEVVVVDNLSNASRESLARVEKLTGKTLSFYEVDIMDRAGLADVFHKEKNIAAVVHFAAKKAVGESVENPLEYYQNNITGSLCLCEMMLEHGVSRIVFSSSSTVYGSPETVPVQENARIGATNPYGHSKVMMEQVLMDTGKVNDWDVVILRYFNPVGAHDSGEIGEDPEYPFNLLPYVSQVAAGLREQVAIFGDDYETPDGTCIRDYIHVVDLAKAHVRSLDKILQKPQGLLVYNLGAGRGYSVKEMVEAFRRISGLEIKAVIEPRRSGDVPVSVGDPSKANKDLEWIAEHDLDDMVSSTWKWQTKYPRGYR